MSLVLNVIWFVFGGFWAALAYFFTGLIFCLTLVGIPFGLMWFRLGVATLAPFGKQVVERRGGSSLLFTVMNCIWLVFFGWALVLGHLVIAFLLAITIVGIPFAVQHIKLVPLALLPFGRELI